GPNRNSRPGLRRSLAPVMTGAAGVSEVGNSNPGSSVTAGPPAGAAAPGRNAPIGARTGGKIIHSPGPRHSQSGTVRTGGSAAMLRAQICGTGMDIRQPPAGMTSAAATGIMTVKATGGGNATG